MQFTTLALATFATLAAAAPEVKMYKIQTVSSDSRFNNMCLVSYHTGAGLGDATLTPCADTKPYFYNDGNTTAWSGFGNGIKAALQAPAGGSSYDDWYPVTISVGDGTAGNYNSTAGFTNANGAGYLVCRWAHAGVPQLFTFAYAGTNPPILSNCGKVKLFKA